MNSIYDSTQTGLEFGSFMICMAASLLLGLAIALTNAKSGGFSKNFTIILILLPATVQLIIALVNGNLGTGIAVAGAFSLVRFRSVPGNAREIGSIFTAMAAGLATGMGYLGAAAVFTAVICLLTLLLTAIPKLGKKPTLERELKITIPENLDYDGIFDDLLEKHTSRSELTQVKTTNLGSLYRLTYNISLRGESDQKPLIDGLRCRNGNLEIVCGKSAVLREEL